MLLTGLNIDCLEGILEYLEIGDLLNVADSNKRLRHASKFVFVRKYGGTEVQLDACQRHKEDASIMIDAYSIYMPKLKFILPLLRNFGPFISRMIYHDRDPCSYYIVDYINDFCSEALSFLRMHMHHRDLLDYFKNPFTNLKTVYIRTGYFTQKNSLVRVFPKVEKLSVALMNIGEQCSEFVRSRCIANHFPYLEYFEMDGSFVDQHKKDKEYIEVFKDFLKLNPQVKHLYMNCMDHAEVDILRVFEEREQILERLELYDLAHFFNGFNGKKLHMKNVKHLSLQKYSDHPLMEGIPIVCNQLETIEIGHIGQFNEHFYDFCQNNSSIRKLIFGWHKDLLLINYSTLAQCLPLLEEITISSGILSVNEVLDAFSLFKCMKYLRFNYSDRYKNEYKELLSHLNDNLSMEFTTERKGDHIMFKRI